MIFCTVCRTSILKKSASRSSCVSDSSSTSCRISIPSCFRHSGTFAATSNPDSFFPSCSSTAFFSSFSGTEGDSLLFLVPFPSLYTAPHVFPLLCPVRPCGPAVECATFRASHLPGQSVLAAILTCFLFRLTGGGPPLHLLMDLPEHFFCDDCGVVVLYEVLGQLPFVLPDVAGQKVGDIRLLVEHVAAVFLIVQNIVLKSTQQLSFQIGDKILLTTSNYKAIL